MTYKEYYLEYKLKYLELKKLIGGNKNNVKLIIFASKIYLDNMDAKKYYK